MGRRLDGWWAAARLSYFPKKKQRCREEKREDKEKEKGERFVKYFPGDFIQDLKYCSKIFVGV